MWRTLGDALGGLFILNPESTVDNVTVYADVSGNKWQRFLLTSQYVTPTGSTELITLGDLAEMIINLGGPALRQALATMTPLSDFEMRRSNQIMQNVWEDTLSTSQEETWTSTAAWEPTTAFQVSGGRMYSVGQTSGAGATRTGATINRNQTARIQAIVNFVEGSGSAGFFIGVSTDASGAVPSAGAANFYGLAILNNGGVGFYTAGASEGNCVGSLTNPIVTGTYFVTVEIDENYISLALVSPGAGTIGELRANMVRPNATVIPYLFNSDTRDLTGSSFGLWAMKLGPASGRKAFGLGTQARTVVDTIVTSVAGNPVSVKVETPVGYDSRVPYPCMLGFHGLGSNENLFTDFAQLQPVTEAFLGAGYIVITACNDNNENTWGIQGAYDAYTAAYQYARDHFNIGPCVIVANSMGGIDSEGVLAERRIPNIVAWIGISPTYNLTNNYIYVAEGTGANGDFTSSIDQAYITEVTTLAEAVEAGATSFSCSYESYFDGEVLMIDAQNGTAGMAENITLTSAASGTTAPYTYSCSAFRSAHIAGAQVSDFPNRILANNNDSSASPNGVATHDPSGLPATAFRNVPMFIFTATDDVTVYPEANGFALYEAMQGVSTEVLKYPGLTGGHSFTMPADALNAMIRFANKYAGA